MRSIKFGLNTKITSLLVRGPIRQLTSYQFSSSAARLAPGRDGASNLKQEQQKSVRSTTRRKCLNSDLGIFFLILIIIKSLSSMRPERRERPTHASSKSRTRRAWNHAPPFCLVVVGAFLASFFFGSCVSFQCRIRAYRGAAAVASRPVACTPPRCFSSSTDSGRSSPL